MRFTLALATIATAVTAVRIVPASASPAAAAIIAPASAANGGLMGAPAIIAPASAANGGLMGAPAIAPVAPVTAGDGAPAPVTVDDSDMKTYKSIDFNAALDTRDAMKDYRKNNTRHFLQKRVFLAKRDELVNLWFKAQAKKVSRKASWASATTKSLEANKKLQAMNIAMQEAGSKAANTAGVAKVALDNHVRATKAQEVAKDQMAADVAAAVTAQKLSKQKHNSFVTVATAKMNGTKAEAGKAEELNKKAIAAQKLAATASADRITELNKAQVKKDNAIAAARKSRAAANAAHKTYMDFIQKGQGIGYFH